MHLSSLVLAIIFASVNGFGEYQQQDEPENYYIPENTQCGQSCNNGNQYENENNENGYKVPLIWEQIAEDVQPIDLKYFNMDYEPQNYFPAQQPNEYQQNGYAPYPEGHEIIDDGLYTILKDNVPILTFSLNLDYIAAVRQPEVAAHQNLPYIESQSHLSNPDFENLYDPRPEYNGGFHQHPAFVDKTDEKARNDDQKGHENRTQITFNNSDKYDLSVESDDVKFEKSPNLTNKTNSHVHKARNDEKGHENRTKITFDNSDKYDLSVESHDINFEKSPNLTNKTDGKLEKARSSHQNHTQIQFIKSDMYDSSEADNTKSGKISSSNSGKHNSTGRESEHVHDKLVHILSKDNNYGVFNYKFGKRETEQPAYNDYEKVQISVGLNQHEVCMALKNIGVSCDDVFKKMCNEKHNTLPICNKYR